MLPPLLGILALLLISGLLAGLTRLGWALPIAGIAGLHGPLMVCGVLGTLIGIERAMAGKRVWGYAAPLLSAGAGLGLLLGLPSSGGALLFMAAALVQIALLWQRARQSFPLQIQVLGLVCWLIGSLLWLIGRPFAEIALWWVGLLLLTIAGGRMDKFLPAGHSRGFASASGLLLVGLTLALFLPEAGLRITGLGLMSCSLWLLGRDPASRPAGRSGSGRLMALCLLGGYLWLGVGGVLLLGGTRALQGWHYDMTLHSLFVGFVFSLILAHLPQLLPHVLKRRPVYHASLYWPVLLLHLSLLLRLAGGPLHQMPLRAWGGLINVLALIAFVLLVLGQVFLTNEDKNSIHTP